MAEGITYVGMDVHVKSVVMCALDETGEVRRVGPIPNTGVAVLKALRKIGQATSLRVCYEAGPTGYGLQRAVTEAGIACVVVAPSLIPKRAGDRVKTDTRDALHLARMLRTGDLTAVAVPTPELEALRELSRAREAAKRDLHRERQRLVKLLHRHGIGEPPRRRRWGRPYRAWLADVRFAHEALQITWQERLAAVDRAQAARDRLTALLTQVAERSPQAEVIRDLQALRGVGVLTAVGIVVEVGDLTRFASPRQLMAFAGVVSSEHSSGGRIQRGGMTKTGNAHLRYLLVEAAWHYAQRMRATTPEPTTEAERIAQAATTRLRQRYSSLRRRGKQPPVANVAVARELCGFIWAIGQHAAGRTLPPRVVPLSGHRATSV